jgi:hypothetical protein
VRAEQKAAAQARAQKEQAPPSEPDLAALYELAKSVGESDDVLALVHDQLVADGYAGDTAPARRVYLAISSRYEKRPINVHRLAQASSGKNYTIDASLRFFPESAYLQLSAASPKAHIF